MTMKKIFYLIYLLSISSTCFSQTWILNKADSRLGFEISNFGIASVDGTFKDFSSTFHASKDDFTDADINLTIETKSIDTGNKKRDRHLRSEDYFEVEKYRTMTFKSTGFKKVSDKKYKLTGNLTLHGVTKSVSVDASLVKLSEDKKEVVFQISGKLKRSDFNLGKGAMEAAMGDEVEIFGKVEYRRE
jgi:polyisoprenoid-binding protein YceI